jgi:transposase
VDQGALVAHQKKVRRLKAALVFIDESGLLMSPYLRRTWHPRGQTPVLRQRTRHHRKVSVIAALVVSPAGRRVRWCFRLHVETSIVGSLVRAFLRQLGRWVRGPLVVVWDRLGAHRSVTVREFVEQHPRFSLEWLPPYAPELNPVEYGWSWLKTNPLSNYAPAEVEELQQAAHRRARQLQHRPDLLRSFLKHSPLSLRLK